MAYAGSVFCGLNLSRKGSEEQKRHWLPRLLSGEVKFSISMSEPDAGSDLGAMCTSARRDGDAWIISGQKLWATGAGAKDNVINVYVKTDPKADIRQGMSLFLVDNTTPGVELRKLDMLERRCTGTYEIFFNDARVTGERLVGGENKGWDCILSGLQVERITSAAGNAGAAQACVDLASDYAKETYVEVANMGMQIFGGYGYSMEFDMQRHYRDSRSATIAAGTSQMQRNLIAGLMGLKAQ